MPISPPAGPPPGVKVLTCGGASCDVKVSVQCQAYVFCWIETDGNWVVVPKGNSPVIRWEVVTPGYGFSENGIAFSSGAPFRCQREGKTKFGCNDMHTEPGIYKYTITLIGLPLVFPKDPFVDNQ